MSLAPASSKTRLRFAQHVSFSELASRSTYGNILLAVLFLLLSRYVFIQLAIQFYFYVVARASFLEDTTSLRSACVFFGTGVSLYRCLYVACSTVLLLSRYVLIQFAIQFCSCAYLIKASLPHAVDASRFREQVFKVFVPKPFSM